MAQSSNLMASYETNLVSSSNNSPMEQLASLTLPTSSNNTTDILMNNNNGNHRNNRYHNRSKNNYNNNNNGYNNYHQNQRNYQSRNNYNNYNQNYENQSSNFNSNNNNRWNNNYYNNNRSYNNSNRSNNNSNNFTNNYQQHPQHSQQQQQQQQHQQQPHQQNDQINQSNNSQPIDKRKKFAKSPKSQKQQQPKPQQQQRSNQEAKKSPSISSTNQTRSEILIEQLTKNKCECMVCYQYIKNDKPIWSCNVCFHIFHMNCIKKWANSASAKIEEQVSDKWRCPCCQTIFDQVPNKYSCFCGKKLNPCQSNHKSEEINSNKPSHLKQLAHSCGEVCSKPLSQSSKFWLNQQNQQSSILQNVDECKHRCVQICHPGPCQECEAMVQRSCNCGKSKFQVKCNSIKKPLCQVKCDKRLNCNLHMCSVECHSGSCKPCDVDIEQTCYSHQEKRIVKCGSDEHKLSEKDYYKCNNKCNKLLSCGNHNCEERCHEGECKPCPLMPSQLTHCPCGKSKIRELLIKNKLIRTSCLDPVPTCESICDKILHDINESDQDLLHTCKSKCHTDKCPPCTIMVKQKCRCGKETDEVECYKSSSQKLCTRRCQKKKSCGRHQCNEICCDDKDHICMMICNRILNCGLHHCEELCHKNLCKRCLVASFEERICECGSTVQYPPIRCGTKPLECNNLCTRRHPCDHPVTHSCHWEEKCPSCSFLTSKMCMGQHELRHNIPCFMENVSCGKPCDKPLKCGHRCIKTCHKDECMLESEVCTQPCEKDRPHCSHPCSSPCHGSSPCPDTICRALILVKCACGLKSKQIKCQQRMYESSQVVFENLASEIKEMLSCRSIDLQSFKNSQALKKKHELACDEECLLAERNNSLAQALQIDPALLTSNNPKPIYSEYLKNYARDEPTFVSDLEKRFESIVKETKASKLSGKKSFNLPIMKSYERKFIHELASYYGFETVSHDPEPYRNICVYAHKDKCYVPSILLSQAIETKVNKPTMPRLANINKLSQMSAVSPLQSNLKTLTSSYASAQPPPALPVSSMYSILTDHDNEDIEALTLKLAIAEKKKNNTDIDYFDLTE